MATNTEHYNLVKPDYADAADVAQLNDNMDIIDSILWQLANAGADEELLKKVQEILDKIGETADTGGSTTLGSVMAKLNEDLKLDGSALQEIINLGVIINGEASPYGTGLLGNVTFDSNKFTWPSQDYYNRYVIQVESLTIPSGQTMKPPAKCDGLYILSKGDVTIDGDIDIRGLRKTFGAVNMSPTINVGTKTFELAKGGYAPKGGASGAGTNQTYGGETATPSPAFTPTDSISGNVNGGGVGKYGVAGISSLPYYTSRDAEGVDNYNDSNFLEEVANTAGSIKTANNAPSAVVIIAKGTVTINGKILASASSGQAPQDGGDVMYMANNGFGTHWHFSVSGDGAMPPSGGGAVTIICNAIIINGSIDTNGKKETYSDGLNRSSANCSLKSKYYINNLNANNETEANDSSMRNYVKGGIGGKGGTFISTAGEIKVYTGVSE